jgi:hypothetical protein
MKTDILIQVKFPHSLKKELQTKAKSQGLSMSAFIRQSTIRELDRLKAA